MKKIYLLFILLVSISFSYGQSVITTIDRPNIVGPTDSGNSPGISSIGLTRGTGIIKATANINFTSRPWDASSQAQAVTNNEYIQWSVKASNINSVEVTGFDIRSRRDSNGPTNWQVFYSLDNFTTAGIAATSVQISNRPAGDKSFTGLSIVSGTNGTITFRLYAWNALTTNGWFSISNKAAWSDFGIANPGLRIWGNITATTPNSTESNIVTSLFDEPDNIDYLVYSATSGLTTANAIKIGQFTIQDGGDDLIDADALGTILTDITFNISGDSNLAALAIFDGVANVGETSTVTATTAINNLNAGAGIATLDGAIKTFDVYATFKSSVIDNDQFQLTINSAVADVTNGSAFGTINAGGAQTSIAGDDNRIEVTTTGIVFDQQPLDGNQFETMIPFPVMLALDANSNLDLDATGIITVVTSGSLMGSPIDYAMVNGVSVFDSLVFTEKETAIELFAFGSGSLGFAISDMFDINGPLLTIAIQDFDGTPIEWTYTNSVPFFDNTWGTDGYYGIIDVSSASPLNYSGFSNNILGENDLFDEGDNGTSQYATIIFDPINITSYDDVILTFDWQVEGYDNDGDDVYYELIYNGASQGVVYLFDGNGIPTADSGSESIAVPNSVNNISLKLRIRNNGETGYSGFDNFKLASVFDGLLYADSSWMPYAPSDTTGSEDAYIYNGTYDVPTNVILNNLYINEGATTSVAFGQSITMNNNIVNNGTLELNSVSTSYSSLIVDGVVFGDTDYKRHVNRTAMTGLSGENDLISPPVSGQTFGNFAAVNTNIVENPSDTSQKLFGPFDKATATYLIYDTDVPADANAVFQPGNGYRAASTDTSTFTFTGAVNTSTVDVPIFYSGPNQQEWNLIGNPYPSYVKLSDWLDANSAELRPVSSGIYGYDGDASDGWTIWNQAYSDLHPEAVITPGQGFLVAALDEGGTISFTPSMRSTGTTDDFIVGKSANSTIGNISHLKLKAVSTNLVHKTEFYISDYGSLGLDSGYDAITYDGIAPEFSIYSHLIEENDGLDMAVQTIGNRDLENNTIIPLGINALQGQQLTISIETSTLDENINVYLNDNLTNTFTLLNTEDYVFTPNSNLNGTGRFYLQFESERLSTEENALSTLQIYATASEKILYIKGLLQNDTTLKLYDIQGREILNETLKGNNTSQKIDLSTLKTGVYIVHLENNAQNRTQKIIIK